jgi:hypothetical protein
MQRKKNQIPKFKNEDEEREFWATHSPLDYFDARNKIVARFYETRPRRSKEKD